jgi:hypothetical protein
MNCNCLNEIEAKLTEHVAKQGVVNPRVSPEFLGINFGDGGSTIINLVYTVRGDNKPYNTQKGKPLNMVASFCPFCGKSAKKAVAEAA